MNLIGQKTQPIKNEIFTTNFYFDPWSDLSRIVNIYPIMIFDFIYNISVNYKIIRLFSS